MSSFMSSFLDRRRIVVLTILLILAFGFRLFVALRLANDTPDDGRVYSQIARNVLEQHVYSHEEQPPFTPTLIRLPGYPFFLVAVYALTGHGNNTAVRVVQAIVDTFTCLLVALVAFQWTENPARKCRAAYAAFVLAAACPFTTIYVATILTEVPTSFLAVLLCLLATLAMKSKNKRRSNLFWILAGLVAGLAVFFRPDSGLFAAAVGLTILLSSLTREQFARRFSRGVFSAAVFSIAFCLVLVPWTIRNRKVFGVFQPLSPAHGEMPGEFVPRGYLMWLRTWLDDGRYIGPVLWRLDTAPISIDAFPKRAFDSTDERARVEELLKKYNYPGDLFEGSGAEGGWGDESAEEENADEENDEGDENASGPDQGDVEMTPEIDAAFAQIARERISRSPFRYYVKLPLLRARSLWFDTHSQYYPFDGELFPLEDLDYDVGQQYWLPLFAGLTWLYTILGALGGWFLWRSGTESRRWLLLAALIIFLRIGFFSSLENPEPRYVVEIFPFLSILGGIAISRLGRSQISDSRSQMIVPEVNLESEI
jgi:4-amino-4-deoxy-L-arabinose transferase-like glycosyltransferase